MRATKMLDAVAMRGKFPSISAKIEE